MGIFRFAKRTGFTLIELLIVLAIIGTLVLIVVPQVGAGMTSTKISTAARSVAQASRYARTMALLNQTETEVVFYSNGSIEVRAAVMSSQRMHNADSARKAAAELASDGFEELDESMSATNSPVDIATSLAMADEINSKFENDGMTFEFVGYTDSVDEEEEIRISAEDLDDEEDEFEFSSKPKSSVIATVLYESNGICRPYHVRVIYDEDMSVDVFVDITGVGKIVMEGEE